VKSSQSRLAEVSVSIRSLAELDALAKLVAGFLHCGDAVLLAGEMATGKTTFVKSLVSSLGSPDLVTSPTFSIANFYEKGRLRVLHIDTFRLKTAREFIDLGLQDFFDECVTLVEWPDPAANEFADPLCISISLDPSEPSAVDASRLFLFTASSERWSDLFLSLRDQAKEIINVDARS
jgi:tRNA threonylcarbamoyladenosine biosynthesis protein TsaE